MKNVKAIIYVLCVCLCSVTQSCPTLLRPHGLQPSRLLCPWDFWGKDTGLGFLFQGIFLTQESNLCLLHLLQILTIESPGKPTQAP